MTFALLNKIIKDNNIPEDVTLMSDSGWECDASHMNGVYYNEEKNVIVFTQHGDEFTRYHGDSNWKLLE